MEGKGCSCNEWDEVAQLENGSEMGEWDLVHLGIYLGGHQEIREVDFT